MKYNFNTDIDHNGFIELSEYDILLATLALFAVVAICVSGCVREANRLDAVVKIEQAKAAHSSAPAAPASVPARPAGGREE